MKTLSPWSQSNNCSRTVESLDDLAYPPPKPEVRRIYALITRKIRTYKFPALKASFDRRKKVYELKVRKMEFPPHFTIYTLLEFEIMNANPIEINASYGKEPNQKVKYVIAPEKLDLWVNDIMAQVFTICL